MSDLPDLPALKAPDPSAEVKAKATANFRRLAGIFGWSEEETGDGLAMLGLDGTTQAAR